MTVVQELLDVLACPKCKGGVHVDSRGDGIICDACGLRYPVRDGVPVMLAGEAEKISGGPAAAPYIL